MEYIVFNGCLAVATYKSKSDAIKRAKRQVLFNRVDEISTEITVIAKQYTTDANGVEIWKSN